MSSEIQSIETLQDLFVDELREAYYVETNLEGELDHMAMRASNDSISTGFADHRDETRMQIERLESAFAALDLQPEERRSPVLDALVEERERFEELIDDDDLLDIVYLGAGMKTERVEMTMYEGLLMNARKLDLSDDVTDPLDENHDEEKQTFEELRSLSGGSELKSLLGRLLG